MILGSIPFYEITIRMGSKLCFEITIRMVIYDGISLIITIPPKESNKALKCVFVFNIRAQSICK